MMSFSSQDALSIAVAAAAASKELTALLSFPPISAASALLLEIFKTIQDLHHNQSECLRLGQRCVTLLADVKDAMGARGGEPPDSLKRNISKFTRSLEELRDDMRADSQGKWHERLLRKSIMEAKLSHYNSMVDDAARSFQIVTLIHIHRAVGDGQGDQAGSGVHAVLSPIYFYEKQQPYFEFSNSSPYSVWHNGKLYPTSAHLFQAYKFFETAPHLAEHIRTQPTAKSAVGEAARLRSEQRQDWNQKNREVMDSILDAKFSQHADLREKLLSTGDRQIVEASPTDSFWGQGADKHGRNELGKCLMRLREKFRVEDQRGHMRRKSTRTRVPQATGAYGGLQIPSGMHGYSSLHRSRSTNC
ncbi:NADAR family protein [Phanerochaete sordida]|uniref:NADAR family protein n=1 Tax=Phanerochaete sordida TaxID=48140 RepID=A0A9P3LI60_9APHY|nr:NADAR family protein [Phanerochaete sordida]